MVVSAAAGARLRSRSNRQIKGCRLVGIAGGTEKCNWLIQEPRLRCSRHRCEAPVLLASITYYPLYVWLGMVTQPGNINYPISIFIIFILVCYVGMVYGPVGAFLAEYFPSRIRYTSVSVPYHIGNGWGGGLVPFITSASFAATGSIGYALIYPIAVPAVCFVLALFLMPGTRRISIWKR